MAHIPPKDFLWAIFACLSYIAGITTRILCWPIAGSIEDDLELIMECIIMIPLGVVLGIVGWLSFNPAALLLSIATFLSYGLFLRAEKKKTIRSFCLLFAGCFCWGLTWPEIYWLTR